MKNQKATRLLCLLPGLGYILVFVILILSTMVVQSFGYLNYTGDSQFTLKYWENAFNKHLYDSFIYSLKVGGVSSFGSIIITYILAILIRKLNLQKTILVIYKVPLFLPALVVSFLILNIFDFNGFVNQILLALHIIYSPIRFRSGDSMGLVYIIQMWKNVPFQLLILYPAIQGIRKDVIEASKNLGAGVVKTFLEIIFPLSLPSAVIAVILVFIGTFGDFAVSSVAGPTYPFSLSGYIHNLAYSSQMWNDAAVAGIIMVMVTATLVGIYFYISNKFIKS